MTEKLLQDVLVDIERTKKTMQQHDPALKVIGLVTLSMVGTTISTLRILEQLNPGTGLTSEESAEARIHLADAIHEFQW